MPFGNSRQEDHSKPDQEDDQSRSEIGLKQDQQKSDKNIETRDKNMPNIGDFNMPLGKIFGQQDDDRQLYQIGGLERNPSD